MEEKKYIALTFDDGPSETTTGEILVKLLHYKIVASFFVVGKNITAETKELLQDAYEMGCEINNHSKNHADLTKLEDEQIKEEIAYTNGKVEEAIHVLPKFFRPPYLSVNERMRDVIDLPMIAGYGCEDWLEEVSATERATRILAEAAPGRVLLLHDAEGNRKTVKALDIIIPELLRQGYHFVTVSRLIEADPRTLISNKKQLDFINFGN